MKIAGYVPMKLNNERLPGKNTKQFSSGRPLFHHALENLRNSSIDEVYVYCSSDVIEAQLPEGVQFLRRDTRLDTSQTSINEVMIAFAQEIEADAYLMAHATAPFLSTQTLDRMLNALRSGKHDSALPVTRLQEFIWKDGSPLNYDPAAIPRTQDLPLYFTETTGAYAYTRELVNAQGRRVGESPALIEVSKIEAIDINEAVDFEIADAIHMMYFAD